MKDWQEFEPKLTAHLLGELSPAEAREVEEALASDPECQRVYAELEGVVEQLRAELGDAPDASLTDDRLAAIMAVASDIDAPANGTASEEDGPRQPASGLRGWLVLHQSRLLRVAAAVLVVGLALRLLLPAIRPQPDAMGSREIARTSPAAAKSAKDAASAPPAAKGPGKLGYARGRAPQEDSPARRREGNKELDDAAGAAAERVTPLAKDGVDSLADAGPAPRAWAGKKGGPPPPPPPMVIKETMARKKAAQAPEIAERFADDDEYDKSEVQADAPAAAIAGDRGGQRKANTVASTRPAEPAAPTPARRPAVQIAPEPPTERRYAGKGGRHYRSKQATKAPIDQQREALPPPPTPSQRELGQAKALQGGHANRTVEESLRRITLPRVALEYATISEGISQLAAHGRAADPSGRGVAMSLAPTPGAEREQKAKVRGAKARQRRDAPNAAALEPQRSLNLDDIPLGEALRYLCLQTGQDFLVGTRSVIVGGPPQALLLTALSETQQKGQMLKRRNNEPPAPPSVGSIAAKLEQTILPPISFQGATLATVVTYLRDRAKALDPAKKGVNFVVALGPPTISPPVGEDGKSDEEAASLRGPRVNVALGNISLGEAVKRVCRATGFAYRIEPHAVVIAHPSIPLDPLVSRALRVDPAILQQVQAKSKGDLAAGLRAVGVEVPAWATFRYLPEVGALVARSTAANLRQIELALAELAGRRPTGAASLLEEVDQQ